jgi:hypothetical protein
VLLGTALGSLLLADPVAAQGYRGSFRTHLNYLQLRPAVADSVPWESVPGSGTRRFLSDGSPVTCLSGYCRFLRSGEELGVVPLMEDLELNVWPGVVGLRGYVHVRARQPLGDYELWPRSDKGFEALAAYAEYSRPSFRVKGGRLWKTSSLGFYNLDGGDLLVRLPSRLQLEAYGGIALVRGLGERHTGDLLSTVEPLTPADDAYIVGAQARWRPMPWFGGSFMYQRETRTDGDGLYSERVAGNLRLRALRTNVELDVKYNIATEEFNEARARVVSPLGTRFIAAGEIRHYRPFFPLWTIWGVFSPVGLDEARAGATWTNPNGRYSAHLFGGYRKYSDTNVESPASPVRDDGWRVQAGGSLVPREDWRVAGEYRLEVGFGASRSGLDLTLSRSMEDRGHFTARGTAFQSLSEFQVGEGTVVGVGADGTFGLERIRVSAGGMIYRHSYSDRPQFLTWDQLRAHLTLEVPIGEDPGLVGRRQR